MPCSPAHVVVSANGRSLRYEAAPGSSLPFKHALLPREMRAALRGRWIYMVGDSSMRGLFLSLYEQLAEMGGEAMDASRWLGTFTNLREIAWVDVVLRASDGSLMDVRSRGVANPKRWPAASIPNPDGGVEHPESEEASSVAHAWCFGQRPAPGVTCGQHRHPVDKATTSAGETNGTLASIPCPVRSAAEESRIRLTWRFTTYASRMVQDPLLELRSRWLLQPCHGRAARSASWHEVAPPDVHVLQTGSWDDHAKTARAVYDEVLLKGLMHWRAAAAASPATTLVFASAPVPLDLSGAPTIAPAEHSQSPQMPRGQNRVSHVGSAHVEMPCEPSPPGYPGRALVGMRGAGRTARRAHEASLWGLPPFHQATDGVPLLDRVASAALLVDAAASQCRCLVASYRHAQLRDSMKYHPPHLHNLWDSQALLSLALPQGHRTDTSRWVSKMQDGPGAVTLTLAHALAERCCCAPPLPRTNLSAASPINTWANICSLQA
jgi:hypothetical protein